MKLMLFLLAGSALLFPALLSIYHASGLNTFDMVVLSGHPFDPDFQIFVYPFVFVGFGVLAGLFPFHGWSPTGHVAAPSAVVDAARRGADEAGGPTASWPPASASCRSAPCTGRRSSRCWPPWGSVYGAFVAMRQSDFKFVVGFSSVSHMGIVILGLNLGRPRKGRG